MRHLLLSILLFAFVLTNAQTSDTAHASLYPASEAAIHQTLDHFVAAWNVHDATAFSMSFAPDADFTNVRGAGSSGREKIGAFHAAVFKTIFKDSHQTMTSIKVRFLTEHLAAVDARWEMTGSVSPTGQAIPLRKGLLNFTMDNSTGQWLILVMHNTELTDMH